MVRFEKPYLFQRWGDHQDSSLAAFSYPQPFLLSRILRYRGLGGRRSRGTLPLALAGCALRWRLSLRLGSLSKVSRRRRFLTRTPSKMGTFGPLFYLSRRLRHTPQLGSEVGRELGST